MLSVPIHHVILQWFLMSFRVGFFVYVNIEELSNRSQYYTSDACVEFMNGLNRRPLVAECAVVGKHLA